MEPALKAIGATPVATAEIEATDRGLQGVQASNAVLRFKNEGVTHVIVVTDVLAWIAFSNQAESQGYRPVYGFGDYQLMIGNAQAFNQNGQASSSYAVTSLYGDMRSGAREKARSQKDDIDPKDPSLLPGLRRCLEVLSKYTGENYYDGASGRSTRYFWCCEHFFLWLDVARAVGNGFTPALWGQQLPRLTGYQSNRMRDTRFGPGIFDGAATYRVGTSSKVPGCLCWHPVREDYFRYPNV